MNRGYRYFKDGYYYGYIQVTHIERDVIYGYQYVGERRVDSRPKAWVIDMHTWEQFNQDVYDKALGRGRHAFVDVNRVKK